MRATWLQHVPFEGPGSITEWMHAHDVTFQAVRPWAGDPLPSLETFDLLVIMGGPMNVDDDHLYPWLADERAFIRAAIDAGKAVVGICLGAQLIARALGAEVHAGGPDEIGWFDIVRTPDVTHPLVAALPSRLLAYHWHSDTFDIPDGAEHVAASATYTNQAFVYGDRVIALQCHLETTEASARDIIDNTDFTPGPTVQPAEDMLADPGRLAAIRPVMHGLLDALAAAVRR